MNTILLGNILGFIASVINIGYFKSNNKNIICLICILVCPFKVASLLVLGAYNSIAIVICNTIRAILTRFDKWGKFWIILFTGIAIVVTIYFYKSPLDFMSVIGVTLNNFGFLLMQKDKLKSFRWLRFTGNILWIVYYIYILAFASMAFEIIYTAVNLREIIVYKGEKLKPKIQSNTTS